MQGDVAKSAVALTDQSVSPVAAMEKQYGPGEKPSGMALRKQLNAIKDEQFPWMREVTKNGVEVGRYVWNTFPCKSQRLVSNPWKRRNRPLVRKRTQKGLVWHRRFCLKRAYEKPAKSDGYRVLVDRLWPRGISKVHLRLDLWAKDVSPTTALRQWFGHDPKRWLEFTKRYKAELKSPEAHQTIAEILDQAKDSAAITLVYGAKDTEHNEAVVLRSVLQRCLRPKVPATHSARKT